MDAIQPFLITPGLIILGGILVKITTSLLINHLGYKYPDIHNNYFNSNMHKERARMANFMLEFVLAGTYKEELSKEDYKYVTRVKIALGLMMIIIVISIYKTFT